jgi:hypothetical protein
MFLRRLGDRQRSARESHVPRRIASVLTVVVCVLTALAEAGLGIMSSTRVTASDILVVLFIVGPCLVFASLAWCHRGPREGEWTLLAIAIGISACGLYAFGDHSFRWHTDPNFRKVQSMTIFFVPLIQWAIVLVVGISLVVRAQISRDQMVGTDAEPCGERETKR